MISFACPACNKQLKVKDELVGKRAKCPACGKAISIPAASDLAAAGSTSNKPSPVPTSGPPAREERTVPPRPPSPPSEAPTIPPGLRPQGLAPADLSSETASEGARRDDSGHPPELTNFLAPPQAPDEIGRLGPYRVLAILGYGGMGVVFRAEDPSLKRLVALKAMLPSLASQSANRTRFVREAQAAAAIDHDNIVHIYQVGEDRGAPFIAMQFLEGEPLDVRMKQGPKLSVAEIVRIGRETALGLAAAHERGLIHRDIKPGNLWLEGKRARVKILDFGLARALSDQTHLTQSGAIIGTPAYMAPEQAGGRDVDHRCDLFSLGCVLYRLCTGETPFKGKDTLAIISALALETPKPPRDINPDVPAELSDLVMQLLAKKPEERPESAKMVAETLQEIEKQTAEMMAAPGRKTGKVKKGATKQREVAQTQAGKSSKRRFPLPWLVGGGVLGLGVVGLLLFFLLRPSGKQASRVQPEGSLPVAQQPEALAPTFKNSLGMKFVWIPPGSFMMGSPKEEIGREKTWDGQKGADETLHKVTLSKGFYMGVYTVTQEQWQEVIGGINPSKFKGEMNLPVEQVSWEDCQEFIKKLREKDKKPYRLPTEAEWEYACRGGTTTPFHFGETISTDQANYNGDHTYGTGKKGVFRQKTTPVGTFAANTFGLFDMHGNVLQWCQDWLGDYPQKDVVDPQGPEEGGARVLRGGSCLIGPQLCRSANRDGAGPGCRDFRSGFRLCFSLEEDGILTPKKDPPKKEELAVLPPTFKNSIGMEFVLVPKGKSWLGGGDGKPGDKEVEIKDDFYLGKYQVTQEEWQKVTGSNPSEFSRSGVLKDRVKDIGDEELKRFPVEMVSWDDVQLFLTGLNKREKEASWLYRLPKETEWEYACRGGPMADRLDSTSDFYFEKPSDVLLPDQANFNNVLKRTCKVGSYKPNRLGLYDMHGNVWEWCDDLLFDPKDPARASRRVARGGGWLNDSGDCRAANRSGDVPSVRHGVLGLRVARVPVGK